MRLVVDIIGFQVTWWACALGAASGHWEPGVAVAGAVLIGQIWASGTRLATLAAVFTAAVVGVVAETAIVASGLIDFAAARPALGLAPLWLISLWMVFATCAGATARMLGERQMLLGAALGALLAPPTYWAGAGLGALKLAEPAWLPLVTVAVVWAIATPMILAVYGRIAARSAA